jgi:site-specific recombinase XerD
VSGNLTGDLHLLQRPLRHRQMTTTEVYARVGDEALRWTVGAAWTDRRIDNPYGASV